MSDVIGNPTLRAEFDSRELLAGAKEAQAKLKAGFESSNRAIEAQQRNASRRIQGLISSINADKPRRAMFELGQAVQHMGGMAALSEGQVARLRQEVERLAAAGAKAPKSLAGLVPTGAGGAGAKLLAAGKDQALSSLAGGGGIAGVLGSVGPAGLAAAAGIGAVTGAAVLAAREITALAAKTEAYTNLSKSTGIGVVPIQQLSKTLQNAGIDAGALETGMRTLSREIASGGSPAARQLGLDFEGLRSKSPEEALRAVAAQIMAIEDPAQRAAAAQVAFGRSGMDLIPVLDDVASGAYKAMAALSEDQVARLNALDDSLDRLTSSWGALKEQILAAALDSTNGADGINGLAAAVETLARAANTPLGKGAVWTLLNLATLGGANAVSQTAQSVKDLETQFGSIGDAPEVKDRRRGRIFGPGRGIEFDVEELSKEVEKADAKRAAANKKSADEKEREAKALQAILDKNTAYLRSREGLAKTLGGEDQLAPTPESLAPYVQMGPVRNLNPNLRIAGGQTIDLSEEARIELLRQNTEKLGDTVEDTANAASVATNRFGNVAESMMAMGGVLGKLGTALAAITGGVGVFKDLGTLKDAKGNAISGFSFGNLKASMKTTEGKMAAGQAAAAGLGALGNALGGKNSVAGSALGGAAAGAQMGAIAGPWGMAAGAVIGGAIGFFKGSKLKSEAKEAGKILGKSVSVEQLQAMKEEAKAAGIKWQDYLKKQKKEEEKAAKVEARQKLEQGLTAAAQAAESLMAKIADGSVKSSAAIQGLFQAVNDQLIKNGIGILDGRLQESKAYTGAAGGAGDVANILAGMRQAGVLDSNVSALGGQAATDLQAQARQAALDAGLSGPEADRAGLAAIAPLLREQLNASVQSGKELDEKTKALLDEAKKNGIEILADPALEQLDVAKQQLDVLERIEKKKSGALGAARGFGPVMTRDLGGGLGPLIQTHPGELAMVLPAHLAKRGGIISAARGYYEDERDIGGGGRPGSPGAGGGDGAGGDAGGSLPAGAVAELRSAVAAAVAQAQAAAPQITGIGTLQVKVDPLMDAQTREAAISDLLDAAADRLAAGTHRLGREIDRRIRESRQAA